MRPDYVHCIRGFYNDRKTSYCGRYIWYEWSFTDIDHAVSTGRNKDRLMICGECWKKVLEYVKENLFEIGENDEHL